MVLTAVQRKFPQLKMSYEEYLEFAGDDEIVEWVDGEVITYIPPTDRHQDLSRFLSTLLDLFVQFFKQGIIRYAPFEVKLWPDGPSRQPDIFFVANEHLDRLTPERFNGSPDIIIEIISPGSVTEDRVRKFAPYEQARVPEYWIIDSRPLQQQADFYILGPDNLYHAASLSNEGRYRSVQLPHFWLDIHWLWQETLPNPQLALAEILLSIDNLPSEVKTTYQSLYAILKSQENTSSI